MRLQGTGFALGNDGEVVPMQPWRREIAVDASDSTWAIGDQKVEVEPGVLDTFTGLLLGVLLGLVGWGGIAIALTLLLS